VTVHERPVGATVEWYTPPSLFERLGLRFDLDPASPNPPVPWVPADRFYWEDGEKLPWSGRVWLNPPYGPAGVPFIERMIDHNHGLLLLPSRTETRIFQRAAQAASAVVFLRDRLHFVRPNGLASRSSFASALLMFGADTEMTIRLGLADLGWTIEQRWNSWGLGTELAS